VTIYSSIENQKKERTFTMTNGKIKAAMIAVLGLSWCLIASKNL
jgi:hypothetical protein